MLRVGLTGGIGAGKSTVARRLAELGAAVVDADHVAREVVEPGTEGLAAVVAAFGPQVLLPDGSLDRPALGRLVFDDEERRRQLNGILHPRIGRRSQELIGAVPDDAVLVHDVPLIVEAGLAAAYHLVIVVDAPVEERVRRLRADRGMAEDDAWARLRSQASDEQRRAVADIWIDNSGPPDAVRPVVDRLWHERLLPFEANLRERRPAPRSKRALLVDPDPSWPAQAARLIARVTSVAGERAVRIDHIGSTSVPGLAAKDVLDVQVVVDGDLAAAGALADDLIKAGLVRAEGRWWDNPITAAGQVDKAMAMNADPERPVNCHVRMASSPAWREVLLLRDWLRATPEGASEYAELKARLAAAPHASIDDYADGKTGWLREALARAALVTRVE